MDDIEDMPDAPIVGLWQARCRNGKCNMLLARIRLSGDSVVEIKCRRCSEVNAFMPEETGTPRPDGQGGYLTTE